MIDNIKLVIADVDFTLVDSKKEIQPLTRRMLNKLHEEGILLGIASGRPLGNHLKGRYQDWKLNSQFDLIIGMNGGEILDVRKNKLSEHFMLKKKYIKRSIKKIECFF